MTAAALGLTVSVYLIKSGLEAVTRVCSGIASLSRECEPVVLLFTLSLISFWQPVLAFFPQESDMAPDIAAPFGVLVFHSGKCFPLGIS